MSGGNLLIVGLVLLLCGSCLGQSGGGGGGTVGLLGGTIAIVCCPCITIGIIVICIKTKIASKKEKKQYLGYVEPATAGNNMTLLDGTYNGNFTQGYTTYEMHADLHFHKKDSHEKIEVYKVKGTGRDEMGVFKLHKGECKLGNVGRVFFKKRYTSMKAGYTKSLYDLIFTGEIQPNDAGLITGTWKFAGNGYPTADDSGAFSLRCEHTPKTLEAEIQVNETPEPPAYLKSTQTGIDLEKSPLLPY